MDEEVELPEKAKRDYQDSPAKGLPAEEQIEYWKNRAHFFEKRAYNSLAQIAILKNQLSDTHDMDEGDWWKDTED